MLNVIIADDELKSAELLQLKLKRYCADINVLDLFTDPRSAMLYAANNKLDCIFLDIEMPGLTGIDVARALINITEIIFVTAYEKYSLEAFRIGALDYLLKPIDEVFLINAVRRLEEKIELKKSIMPVKKLNTRYDKIGIPASDGMHFVALQDIMRVKAESNYCVFYFSDKSKLTVSKTLKQVEEVLESYDFFRPHKSNIINLNYIKTYLRGEGGIIIMKDGSEVELSRQKKNEFLQLFGKL